MDVEHLVVMGVSGTGKSTVGLELARVARRTGHWMPSTLLGSPLATLEPLHPDEDGVTVPVGGLPEAVVTHTLAALAAPA